MVPLRFSALAILAQRSRCHRSSRERYCRSWLKMPTCGHPTFARRTLHKTQPRIPQNQILSNRCLLGALLYFLAFSATTGPGPYNSMRIRTKLKSQRLADWWKSAPNYILSCLWQPSQDIRFELSDHISLMAFSSAPPFVGLPC